MEEMFEQKILTKYMFLYLREYVYSITTMNIFSSDFLVWLKSKYGLYRFYASDV